MAVTRINKTVKFKTAGQIKMFSSPKVNSTVTTRNVTTGTTYNVTQSSGSFYYISEFKKWIVKSLVEEVNKTTSASPATNNNKYRFKDLKKLVYIYQTSSITKPKDSIKPEDKLYVVSSTANGRSYIESLGGWVLSNLLEKSSTTYEQDNASKVKEEKKKQEEAAALDKFLENIVQGDNDSISSTGNSSTSSEELEITDTSGVWGMPYQFSKSVDPKLEGTSFGAYYADRVVSRMPLLILSPGKVAFMKNSSSYDKEWIQNVITTVAGGGDTTLGSYLQKPGKYYSFEYDTNTYWEYVNTMNMASAVFLGIEDVEITINGATAKIKNFDWEKSVSKQFSSWLQSSDSFVTFYADSETSAGESFSNSTSSSMIADTLNKSSDLGKEIRFLLGEHGVLTDEIINKDTIKEALSAIDGLTDGLLGENNIVSQLGKEFAVIATGGKLIFPEIWSDSTFTKDFDVKIKLRCPCPNKVAWFLDICVPLNCLLAFTLPRTPHGKDIAGEILSQDITANGYFSPFLVRGFYKGASTVDMGIVTDLRIDKGKEGSWTIDALPTEVDVSLGIKDLYNTMAMSSRGTEGGTQLINNTQFMSYLAFNCGISLNTPDLDKSVLLWGMVYSSSLFNTVRRKITGYDMWKKLQRGSKNLANNIVTGWIR